MKCVLCGRKIGWQRKLCAYCQLEAIRAKKPDYWKEKNMPAESNRPESNGGRIYQCPECGYEEKFAESEVLRCSYCFFSPLEPKSQKPRASY